MVSLLMKTRKILNPVVESDEAFFATIALYTLIDNVQLIEFCTQNGENYHQSIKGYIAKIFIDISSYNL